jgi:hypothetical protein
MVTGKLERIDVARFNWSPKSLIVACAVLLGARRHRLGALTLSTLALLPDHQADVGAEKQSQKSTRHSNENNPGRLLAPQRDENLNAGTGRVFCMPGGVRNVLAVASAAALAWE